MQRSLLPSSCSRHSPALPSSLVSSLQAHRRQRAGPCQGQRRYPGYGRYGDERDLKDLFYDPKVWEEGVRTAAQVAELARQFATRGTQASEKFTEEVVKDVPQFLPVDVLDKESQYHLLADVPGLQKSDLKITVNPSQRSVTIKGDRLRDRDVTDSRLKQKFERRMGKFERVLTDLPDDADLTGVGAKVDKGVLTIYIDKISQNGASSDEIDIEIR